MDPLQQGPSGGDQVTDMSVPEMEPPAAQNGVGVIALGVCGSGLGAAADMLAAAGLVRCDEFDAPLGPNTRLQDHSRRQVAADLSGRMLLELGWGWDAPPAVAADDAPTLVELVEHGRKRAERILPRDQGWFSADTREALLLPWWSQILHDRFVALLIMRDPVAVAKRLEARYGMPLDVGLSLWSAYHRHLAGGIAGHRLVIADYATLLREPHRTVRRVLDGLFELGVTGPLDYATAANAIRVPRRTRGKPEANVIDGELLARATRVFATLTAQPITWERSSSLSLPPPSDGERMLLDTWRQTALDRSRTAAALESAEEELAMALSRARSAETRATVAESRARSVENLAQQHAREAERLRRSRNFLSSHLAEVSRTLPGRLTLRWSQLRSIRGAWVRRLGSIARTGRLFLTLRRPRGLRPSPLFDAEWYHETYPDTVSAKLSPWRHYHRHGATELRKPNEWFDLEWYLRTYPDVPRDPLAAIEHYLYDGAWAGRDPGPDFASLGYLRDNPDVVVAGVNPLTHYLSAGKAEGRSRDPHSPPVAPPGRLSVAPQAPLVSIIMTTFDSGAYVGKSIDSLLAQTLGDFELVIVDDASNDDTLRVIRDYARADARIRPFASRRNHGTYWCKNFGLTQARGEFVTTQDSDDASHPERLARQVESLLRHPTALMASVNYVRVTDAGRVVLNRGLEERRAIMALMYRRQEVVSEIGYYDSVRTSADQEFLERFLSVFGRKALVHQDAPLYKALVRDDSLTGGRGDNAVVLESEANDDNDLSFLSPERREYQMDFQAWHRDAALAGEGLYLAYPPSTRPFPVSPKLQIGTRDALDEDTPPLGPGYPADWVVAGCHEDDYVGGTVDHDVVILSDFCFPGGTSQANAAEIEALARAGYATALCQADSTNLRGRQPTHPKITKLTRVGKATWLVPGERATCRLLVVRHPAVIALLPKMRTRIDADRVVVIVNQVPVDRDGRRHYDVLEAQSTMRSVFGTPGEWFPISNVVRDELEAAPGLESLGAWDWHEVIDVAAWTQPRGRSDHRRLPVIGRHSRASADKWPGDEETMRKVYPTDGSVLVEVLGGADPAQKLLGELPGSWSVYRFGEVPPREFLRGLDFFVYFHHPDLIEAFGRTVLEAVATGIPAVLPHHFESTFGEAAVYAEPEEVQKVIHDLWTDERAYERQVARGLEYANEHFNYQTHVDRVRRLLGPVAVDGAAASLRVTTPTPGQPY